MAAILLIGLVGALLGPRFVRTGLQPVQSADEDRSDRKHWNNDASLQFRD